MRRTKPELKWVEWSGRSGHTALNIVGLIRINGIQLKFIERRSSKSLLTSQNTYYIFTMYVYELANVPWSIRYLSGKQKDSDITSVVVVAAAVLSFS